MFKMTFVVSAFSRVFNNLTYIMPKGLKKL